MAGKRSPLGYEKEREREREKESRPKICLDTDKERPRRVSIFLDRVLATLASSSKRRSLLARSTAIARDPKPVFCIRNLIRVTFSDPVHRLPTTYPLRDIREFVPAIVRREPPSASRGYTGLPREYCARSPSTRSARLIISSIDPSL